MLAKYVGYNCFPRFICYKNILPIIIIDLLFSYLFLFSFLPLFTFAKICIRSWYDSNKIGPKSLFVAASVSVPCSE